MDEARLRELVDKQYSAPYRAITVATNLTFAQVAEMIMDRDFKKALFITPVWKRTYPAAQYAAHVVGYVAEITKEELETRDRELYRGGDMIGKNGIEREYEDVLRGAAGEEVIEVDSRGRRLRNISYVKTQKGGDMTLTIDLAAQRYAAELMGKFRGALIAMDVSDGSIRCLYSSPSYDPNPLTWGISNKEWAALTDHIERPMMNRAISGAYPPASTFKVVTGTAILENKIANRNTKINCPGWFELGNRRFRCWKRSGHGKENVTDALRDSCDVYFYELANKMGVRKLMETEEKFGVGCKTGIDLSGEASGTLPGPEWKKRRIKESWYGGDTVNNSIGQGYVLMTPLQVVRVYAALANGGKLLKPRLNTAAPADSEPLGVDPAVSFGVRVAGKTGTAQNSQGDDHAWFAGYAPVDNPRYAVVAIAEAGKAGSSLTGPIVGKMLNFLINGDEQRCWQMIQLKGRQAGALKCVIPADMSERQMIEGFAKLLSMGSHLFEGSEIVIDLQTRVFSPSLLSKIWKSFIEPSGCFVKEWIVADERSRVWLDRMGFRTAETDRLYARREAAAAPARRAASETLVHAGTVRGGQKVAHNGDVLVIGNVNQGAEISASGNVTVIGRLNGLVHAGCGGDDGKTIVARSLETGQIRIGTKVGIIDKSSIFWGKSVFIKISENEVQVIPWPAL